MKAWMALLMLATPAWAQVTPATTDARAIMTAVERRDMGDRSMARWTVKVTDGQGNERTRTIQVRALNIPGGTDKLILFESPADVRNTALLTVDWDAGDRADDQWLYLPSLHKSARISTEGKSGAFMGTDLTYSDLTRKDPDQYDYQMVQPSAPVDGDDCWLVQATPRTPEERKETGYDHMQVWVSKSRVYPIRMKIWLADGKRTKLVQFSDIRKTDGIWVAYGLVARTLRGDKVESTSVVQVNEARFNLPTITEADFTQARLEQGL